LREINVSRIRGPHGAFKKIFLAEIEDETICPSIEAFGIAKS
jgi:hypothetical protein